MGSHLGRVLIALALRWKASGLAKPQAGAIAPLAVSPINDDYYAAADPSLDSTGVSGSGAGLSVSRLPCDRLTHAPMPRKANAAPTAVMPHWTIVLGTIAQASSASCSPASSHHARN